MTDVPIDSPAGGAAASLPPGESARALHWRLIWLYVWGSIAAVVVSFGLVLIGLEFNLRQWLLLFVIAAIVVPIYMSPDIYVIGRHYRPIRQCLRALGEGRPLSSREASGAIVRALNLPFYSFVRVTFLHGPAATGLLAAGLVIANAFFGAGYALWQIVTFAATVLLFASPVPAIFEFFAISRGITPTIERLWGHCDEIEPDHLRSLIAIKLRNKLLYLSVFITALPLLYLAVTTTAKVDLLVEGLGFGIGTAEMTPLFVWVVGIVLVCLGLALAMSILTASEVSRSAAKLVEAMRNVEEGRLHDQLSITGTDEYADLFRGFNLMTAGLREEVRILEVTHELSGELNLDGLLERIMGATTELLDADGSTVFVHDPKTNELWSRFAEGMGTKDIRFPADAGIAGEVFTSGEVENVTDPYAHPRFNPEIDHRTGYKTESILCMPISGKSGQRIGVTQVLNKHGGAFTAKDESRLRAFTAQVSVSLENAQLFDDVLNMKNYNDSILKSTSNGLITLDSERKVVTANEAALSILHTSAESLVEHPAAELFADGNAWVLDSLAKVTETGATDITVDADFHLPEGAVASLNLTTVPLIDIAEENIGSMLILEDMTGEKRVKTTMARYMSKEVADQLLEGGDDALEGKDQTVSILFSDVRDFTSVSEVLGARGTVSMLNEYFEEMVEVIFAHGGILDKYIGDAIMALFGAPFRGDSNADNAVSVASDMMVTLAELNVRRLAAGKDEISIGIGVATGDVVAGNIGSPKRMDYTVIGDSVNLAARLEGATKFYGAPVLVSEHTVKEMRSEARLREIDLMRVKGQDQPVAAFEVLDYHSEATFPNLDETLECYRAGLRRYRERDWHKAGADFERALAAHAGDRPSEIYLERCAYHAENPPPSEWDGVWVHTEK